jgi:hypothetical protein
MKKASKNPAASNAGDMFNEGFQLLESLIAARHEDSAYPFHILGSQGLGWVRHGRLTTLEKRSLLQKLLQMLKEGLARHPFSRDLKSLQDDLQRELLSTAL